MFSFTQILLVTLFYTLIAVEMSLTSLFFYGKIVFIGVVTGLIMGNVSVGFYIGGTYELMAIGLNALGGSSVPNYNIATAVAVAFAAVGGKDLGMAVGIIVATLATSLDVFGKAVGSVFLHKAQSKVQKHDFKGMYRWIRLGFWPRVLINSTIPVFLILVGGSVFVQTINKSIPAWLLTGFQNAGALLPGMGFAILLRSLPIKGNFTFTVLGYTLFAYLKMPVLGIALIGIVAAVLTYNNNTKLAQMTASAGGTGDE